MEVVEVLVFIVTGTQFQHLFATQPKQFIKTAEHECPEQALCSTSLVQFLGNKWNGGIFQKSSFLLFYSKFYVLCHQRVFWVFFLQQFRSSCLHWDSAMLCITQFTTPSPEPASLSQHPSVSSVNLDNKDVFVNGSYCRFYFVYV